MDDLSRYNEMSNHIVSMEVYFDVLHVISRHDLLGEIKSSSINYIFSEMAENLELIKMLNEEAYERIREERGFSRYVSPF
jgi:hypothetical protein